MGEDGVQEIGDGDGDNKKRITCPRDGLTNVPFVEIRGVTDIADHKAPSDFEVNLEVAMNHIATLITAWLSPG